MAIGLIVGVATGALVNALVTDLINPIIGAIIGKVTLDELTFTIGKSVFKYGHLIGVLINFLLILSVVYVLFKVLRLERLGLEEEKD